MLEMIQEMERVFGRKALIKPCARRDGDAFRLVADSSLLRQELGFSPQKSELAALCEDLRLVEDGDG